jgi:hypothetical protein
MAAIELDDAQGRGKLVALEGDIETISTQLRLLPPSQKILVLPSLLENLAPNSDTFDARSFVRDVHDILTERMETARSFLQSSTSTHPRLVFMNGGSVRARATCITRISENITNGNVEEAETIFNDIVKDGVAGIMRHDEVVVEDEQTEKAEADEDGEKGEREGENEDPTLKAMQNAEFLDRENAVLQSEQPAHNTTKLNGHNQDEGDDTENKIFEGEDFVIQNNSPVGEDVLETTAINQEKTPNTGEIVFTASQGEEIRRTMVTVPSKTSLKEKRNTFGPRSQPATPFTATSSPAEAVPQQTDDIDDDGEFEHDLISPDETLASIPRTPPVEYGEARAVNVQTAEAHNPVRKVKSVDRFFPSLFKYQEPPMSPKILKHTTSAYHLRSKPMAPGGFNNGHEETFQTLPRTTFIPGSQTAIRGTTTLSDAVTSSASSTLAQPLRVFIDRGTDPEEIIAEVPAMEEEVGPFEPVFAVVEDLVINFHPRGSNEIFDSVMRSYKNGSYPVLPTLEPTEQPELEFKPLPSPISAMTTEGGHSRFLRPTSHLTAETDDVGCERRHTYDPYAYQQGFEKKWPPKDRLGRAGSAVQSLEPPTPCSTPPPHEIAEKFLDFAPVNVGNAISVQNSLRQVLSVHFPTSDGYSQHICSAGSEMDRLWKPVFRNDESAAIGNEGRTVDQIVALGCEDGVRKDYFAQISGQIERLGTKKDGVSRSGKLDIRSGFSYS